VGGGEASEKGTLLGERFLEDIVEWDARNIIGKESVCIGLKEFNRKI
jgi:hypothetical protein